MSSIAVDYDGTYTADPNLWFRFIQDAVGNGHSVFIVTMRYPSECTPAHGFDSRLSAAMVPVVATGRTRKRKACEKLGIDIDIWCDDHPEAVFTDADSIWSDPAPEGNPVDPIARAAARGLAGATAASSLPGGG